jgi:hypothetical protein
VSILGSEGKGKSTILNALFGTEFIIAAEFRDELTRTTSGVDVAVSNELIILDVEGFDSSRRQGIPIEEVKAASSREARPEEEVKTVRNIEGKFALFVLLATDVIIINLMYKDCGTYQASGLKSLETIFKAAKQLHQEKPREKKRIVFFVRDVKNLSEQGILAIENTIKKRLQEL